MLNCPSWILFSENPKIVESQQRVDFSYHTAKSVDFDWYAVSSQQTARSLL